MIMAGAEYMHQKPFDHVYFTGMVRDKQGRKMSKSLGNSPDLLKLIDRFGADAVRFGILISAPAGNDLLFDESSCEQGRNFNNKIWNALKLVKMWEEKADGFRNVSEDRIQSVNFATAWFDHRLNEVKKELENMYRQFRLREALKTVYSLIWDDFCSWYLEWVKPPYDTVIDHSVYLKTKRFFEELMQLLHPFMPFVTEEIYHRLDERNDDLCIKQFTETQPSDNNILKQGEVLKQTISGIRDARIKNNIKQKDSIKLYIQTSDRSVFSAIGQILSKQVNATEITFTKEPPGQSVAVVISADKFYLVTDREMDTSSQKEQLQKELEYHKGFLVSVEKKLGNDRFVQNAKPEVVEIERRKKADAEQKIKALEESLAALG